MADPQLAGLVRDPDFIKLSPQEQRQALSQATGDKDFGSLSDGETLTFLNKARNSQPTQFEQERQPQGFWSAVKQNLPFNLAALGTQQTPNVPISAKGAAATVQDRAQQQYEAEQAARKQAGYGPAYRTIAPIGQYGFGVNAPGMEQAAKTGDAGAILGNAAVPATLAVAPVVGGELVSRLGNRLSKAAPGLYRSALKPSTTLPPEQVGKIINTALTNEIPVSGSGLEKIGSLIDDLNGKIADEIAQKGQGVEINPKDVARRMGSTKSTFATQVNPDADLAALQSAKQEFLDKHTQVRPFTKIAPSEEGGMAPVGQGQEKVLQGIPAAEAQAEKIGTYRQLKSKSYGELKGASVEAQKALARGLKEELVNAIPELKALNAKESNLLQLQPVLEKAVNRIANHQVIGIGTPAAAVGAEAVTGSMKAAGAAALVKAVLDNPVVKSRLAIAMSKAPGMTIPMANARLAAYSYALSQSAAAPSNPANSQTSSQSTQ